MNNTQTLRGMATVSYWADDLKAARDWYSELLGIEAYYNFPDADNPAYIEFRIGDHQAELGIIDRKYAPQAMQPGPGGAILLWHVDDIEAMLARLMALGAQVYEPITPRGDSGFVTASVVTHRSSLTPLPPSPVFAGRGGMAAGEHGVWQQSAGVHRR